MYDHQVPAHVFWQAFSDSLREEFQHAEAWQDYSSDSLWSTRMFGRACRECQDHKPDETTDKDECFAGILGATLRRLKDAGWDKHIRRFCDELYAVDAAFASTSSLNRTVEGWEAQGYNGRRFPASAPILIDHENQGLLETEFHKLLFLRAPLKVVIGYDFKKKVSSRMLAPFSEGIKQSRQQWPEHSETQYLLIVGKRDGPEAITWQAWKHGAAEDSWTALPSLEITAAGN